MKILIADDDLTYRTILEAVLKKWGMDYISTVDGEEAWNILQLEDAPRLLLLDWEMPNLSGTELCKRIRESEAGSQHHTYIILLTSKQSSEDMAIGLNAGADDYIAKPFQNQELHARILVGQRMINLQIQLEAMTKELKIQAKRDLLTGLYNRRAIEEALELKFEEAKREASDLCVCMCDIDNFKTINDQYGHPIGDLVLKRVALAIKNALRPYDQVGRYGGEEFLLVIHAKQDVSYELLERVRNAVSSLHLTVKKHPLNVTISLGYSCFNNALKGTGNLIALADKALYKAKNSGKNKTEYLN